MAVVVKRGHQPPVLQPQADTQPAVSTHNHHPHTTHSSMHAHACRSAVSHITCNSTLRRIMASASRPGAVTAASTTPQDRQIHTERVLAPDNSDTGVRFVQAILCLKCKHTLSSSFGARHTLQCFLSCKLSHTTNTTSTTTINNMTWLQDPALEQARYPQLPHSGHGRRLCSSTPTAAG